MFTQSFLNTVKAVRSFTSKFSANPSLLVLDDYLANKSIANQTFLGRQTVSVSAIGGTMQAARCRDFDASFRLLNKHGQDRLKKVAQANQKRQLPPIVLVLVGSTYFVQDGHHRVSLAASNGQEFIDAKVTLLSVTDSSAPSLKPAFA